MKKYRILISYGDPKKLEADVNDLLARGWVLQGGLVMCPGGHDHGNPFQDSLAQAMALPADAPND